MWVQRTNMYLSADRFNLVTEALQTCNYIQCRQCGKIFIVVINTGISVLIV
jgi:hypothetical protein